MERSITDHNSSLSLKPSNLELLVSQFNNATPGNDNDSEKITSPKYYDIDEMYNIEIHHKYITFPIPYIHMFS